MDFRVNYYCISAMVLGLHGNLKVYLDYQINYLKFDSVFTASDIKLALYLGVT